MTEAEYNLDMDKYDGINKPEVRLSRNDYIERREDYGYRNGLPPVRRGEWLPEEQGREYAHYGREAEPRSAKGDGFNRAQSPRMEEECAAAVKGGRIKSFFMRAAAAALLLGFLFLPKVWAYNGSDKVTETAKAIVMTDITGNDGIGEGKLVDAIRALLDKLKGNG